MIIKDSYAHNITPFLANHYEKIHLVDLRYFNTDILEYLHKNEIKDILAYLKTIDNGRDDLAVKLIINVPKRGIGATSINKVTNYAFENDLDFYTALRVAGDIPGMGKALKDVDMDNSAFKGIEAIILSMTPYEREHPECINGSRRKRIADGSGTSLPEVNKLLKQFEGTRKMMKTVMGANMGNMMKGAMKRRR